MLRIVATIAALIALLLLYATHSVLAWLVLAAMFAQVVRRRITARRAFLH